jgi:choline-sulfatase
MIENIDARAGELIAKVRERGELANTLIVFSSDHGEMLGDHNFWGKTQPYHGSTGVPLIVGGLDVRPATNHSPTSTLDLTATFLDYAGIPRPPGMDSRSLRPVLTGRTPANRSHALSGLGDWRLVIRDNYKYIRGPVPRLFDLKNDPHENENLAASNPRVVAELEGLLPKAAARAAPATPASPARTPNSEYA